MRAQAQAKLAADRAPAGRVPAPASRKAESGSPGPVPTEHQEQVVFVRWLELSLPEMFEMATAVPHGGYRKPVEAALLVSEGVSSGYPDVLIDLPRGSYHGLRVEMKRAGAPPSAVTKEQLAWHERLRRRGYRIEVCRGADEAMAVAAEYWELGEFRAAGAA